jgi:hypothetical protein
MVSCNPVPVSRRDRGDGGADRVSTAACQVGAFAQDAVVPGAVQVCPELPQRQPRVVGQQLRQ